MRERIRKKSKKFEFQEMYAICLWFVSRRRAWWPAETRHKGFEAIGKLNC